MKGGAREILGRKLGAAGERFEVRVSILAPEKDPEHGDFSCRIRCPALFRADKRIGGVDADQAWELATMFVEQILTDRGYDVVGG